VRDQFAVLEDQGMDAAERVVEGVVRDAVEDGVHQVPDGRDQASAQVGGVGDA
jgi:hypothetical protein